jgi:glycosyltransferase involved in cell wall biosynthesis
MLQEGRRIRLPIEGDLEADALTRKALQARYGVDPLDVEAIASALQRVVDDEALAADMGRRGLQAVQTTYNWQVAERRLLSLYRDLIGPP